MEDLRERKDKAVRKKMPEEWFKKEGLEHVEDDGQGEKEEGDLEMAPRETEADIANDIK